MADATVPTLARASRVVATDEQVSAELAEETVILSMRDGHYYGLEGVGSRVWGMLGEPREFGELVDTVVAEFEVDAGTAAVDLTALFVDLERRGLVTVERVSA
jgi:hypothetical protein